MATVACLKMQSVVQPGRAAYRTISMGAGDDSTPIKGLIRNESVVVSLTGTVTSVMVETRMVDTDPWAACATAAIAAAGAYTFFNVLDQVRVTVTTGVGVFATILARLPS